MVFLHQNGNMRGDFGGAWDNPTIASSRAGVLPQNVNYMYPYRAGDRLKRTFLALAPW